MLKWEHWFPAWSLVLTHKTDDKKQESQLDADALTSQETLLNSVKMRHNT